MHQRPAISEEAIILRGPLITGFSDEDFFQFCQNNPDLRVERTSEGEIIFMSPAGYFSSAHSGELFRQLANWNVTSRLGRVGESSAAFILPDNATLSPDVSWFSLAKWARVPTQERNKFLRICPEFIVEVKSPSDRLTTLHAKLEQWLRNGVQLGLLFHTEAETVWIYRPDQPVEEIQGYEAEISGEPLLPGFVLDLRALREEE